MNCEEIGELLPAFVYGDLSANARSAVEAHLAACPHCREEQGSLAEAQRLLSIAPVADVEVNILSIVEKANRRQHRKIQIWRRAAYWAASAAAVFLVVLLTNVQLRWQKGELAVRFGSAPGEKAAPLSKKMDTEPAVTRPPAAEVTEAEFKIVKDLLYNLAALMEERDSKWEQNLAALEMQLNQMEELSRTRWAATERYVSALQSSQLASRSKGD